MSDIPSPTLKQHLAARPTWTRGLFMLLFAVVFWVAEFLLLATAVFQFGFVLFTGRCNKRLLDFGEGLSRLFYEVVAYLTFNTEEKPFPFSDWPGHAPPDADLPAGDGGYP